MTPTRLLRHRRIEPAAHAAVPPVSWLALGLTVAAAMLLGFYALVSGAVQTSEENASKRRLAGQREAVCRGAATGVARDLCMLTAAAVSGQPGAQSGSHTLGPTGLQARAH